MSSRPLPAAVQAGATHCSYCPKLCRYTCPVAEATGRESVTPWGINRVIAAAQRTGQFDPATASTVYACTGCRACGSACLPGLDLPSHTRAARASVVAAGHAPSGIEVEAGREHRPQEELTAAATPGAEVLVYPGCRSTAGASLATVFAILGIDFDVAAEATCCGARSADVGLADLAASQLADLEARVGSAATIVVADPHCGRWLRIDHGNDRVTMLPEFLAGLVPSAADGGPDTVVWHDPCWLGRGLGSYEPARAVLTALGARLIEPERIRDRAVCTGGGMGFPTADPGGAAAVLASCVQEIAAVLPADGKVVTGCPTAAGRIASAGLPAEDLADYVAGRLQG